MAVLLLHLQHPSSSSSSFQFKFPSMITTLAPDLIIKDRRRRVVKVVFSRVKDAEPWILNDVRNSSAATSVKPSDEEDQKQTSSSYYVNTGNAIRTLRQDFPDLFYRDLTFNIYRDDIVFQDPLNSFYGIESYKTIFWALRFSGRIFFKTLWVDIISVWQPVESTIMIRWAVHGISWVPWERRGRFDATSEYKLDKSGKIYQHRVHNIALNAPPKFQVLSVNELIQSLGCPKATYFETDTRQMK
ncbi:uncharacterized protein LOC143539424 [Bidens hawaiensis]|uniref:uncharacterized protein LOC143539424 n=1 Tax=Bidens hawaiensis TaxID=980011 RepID=UPI00404A6CA1